MSKLQRFADLLEQRATALEASNVTRDVRGEPKWKSRHPAWQVATLREIAAIARQLDDE